MFKSKQNFYYIAAHLLLITMFVLYFAGITFLINILAGYFTLMFFTMLFILLVWVADLFSFQHGTLPAEVVACYCRNWNYRPSLRHVSLVFNAFYGLVFFMLEWYYTSLMIVCGVGAARITEAVILELKALSSDRCRENE
jgi:hypothetical protein